MKIKDVTIVGAGGVGGFLAGKIIASGEYRVSLIARGSHLKAIQSGGLILNTPEGKSITGKPYIATDLFDEIPSPDLAFITVKGYDLESVVKSLKNRINKNTVILPLLNGVDIYERVKKLLPEQIILPGCIYISSHIEKPGVITQTGGKGLIVFGRDPKGKDIDPKYTKKLLEDAEIPYQWEEDSFPAIWTKFVFIASFALVTAYSGKTIGEVLEKEQLRELVHSIGDEIVEIATKKGIKLPQTVVEDAIKKAYSFPPDTKTSYQRDMEIPGKPNEGDLFGGTIIRMGKELGVATPITEKLYTKLNNSP